MAKKPEPIVRLAAQTARQIFANSGNYMAFLTTAAHNFKYSFRDQLLIYAQKPDATACAQTDFWNKHGRWVNKGTTGIALLVDTDKSYKLRHVFDMSDTNSRAGRTVPVWQMRPQYEGPVVEALENSYGEFSDKADFAECLMEAAKIIVEDNFGDYYADLCRVKEGSLLEELDDLNTEVWFKRLLENSVAYIMLTRCGIDPQEYFSGEDFARIYDFNTLKTLAILGAAASDIAEMPLREIASTVLPLYWEEEKQNRTFAGNPDRQYNDGRTKRERSVEHGADIQNRGRLSTAQPGRAGGPAGRKIWDAAAQFPRQSPARDLHGDAADRGAISKRLFRGQDTLTLEVTVHHDNDGFIIGQLPDDAGHRGQARQFRRQLAPVARHHLITAVRHRPHQHGGENAPLPDALHHLLHFLVHPHLERVVGKVADLGGGQVDHIAALGVVPFLLGGEHTIY